MCDIPQFGYMRNLLMIFKSSQISSLLAGLWEDVREEKAELMFSFIKTANCDKPTYLHKIVYTEKKNTLWP